ncbi:hypothetical protein [Roseobacter sp.]|uniref:hypothetical protein n=1 Tax=Roseobacter sp. TaxID=1907202 RepID=UPI0038592A96
MKENSRQKMPQCSKNKIQDIPCAPLTNISTLHRMLNGSNIVAASCFSKAVESGIGFDIADAYIEPGPPGHRRATGPAR